MWWGVGLVSGPVSPSALSVASSIPWKMDLLVFLIFLFSTYAAASLYEGDSCAFANGSSGVCTLLNNCSTVIERLKDENPPETVCGYSRFEPIVCCPFGEPQTITTSHDVKVEEESSRESRGFISKKKCEQYAKSVFALRPSIILGDDRWLNHSQCGIRNILINNIQRGADRMEFPHVAAIGYESETGEIHWECSGSLISEEFVLTAGNCSFSSKWGNAAWVRLGDLHLIRTDDGAQPVDRRISEIMRHPDHQTPKLYHDIALLRLETGVTFNGWIRPACLHTASRAESKRALVTGWGSSKDDVASTESVLSTVTVPLVDHETCNAEYDGFGLKTSTIPEGVIEDWSICAKPAKKGECQSETGAGLAVYNLENYCMYDIIGVKSTLGPCGQQYPRLYSRVSHYVPWIESIVWKNG